MLNQDQPGKQSKEESARSEELLSLLATLASELHPGRQRQRPPNLESSFERELGLDSLAGLELALRLERQFGVRLAEDALMEAETPADLLAAINTAGLQRSERRLERAAAPEATLAPTPLAAKTLADVLEFHVEHHGDRPHIHLFGAAVDAQPTTCRELWQSAQSFASGLRDHGIENGATIAIMLPTGASFFSVFFGCLLAGAVPVPIYPPMRRAQIEEHLRRQAGIGRYIHVTLAERHLRRRDQSRRYGQHDRTTPCVRCCPIPRRYVWPLSIKRRGKTRGWPTLIRIRNGKG